MKRIVCIVLLLCVVCSITACGKPEVVIEYVDREVVVEVEKIVEVPIETIVEKEVVVEVEKIVEVPKEIIKEVDVQHFWVYSEFHGKCGLICKECGIEAEGSWAEHSYIYNITQNANCCQNEITTLSCARCGYTFSYISKHASNNHNYARRLILNNGSYKVENKCVECGVMYYTEDYEVPQYQLEIRGYITKNNDLSTMAWINISVNIQRGHHSETAFYNCTFLNTEGIYCYKQNCSLEDIPGFNVVDASNTIVLIELFTGLHKHPVRLLFDLGDWINHYNQF